VISMTSMDRNIQLLNLHTILNLQTN